MNWCCGYRIVFIESFQCEDDEKWSAIKMSRCPTTLTDIRGISNTIFKNVQVITLKKTFLFFFGNSHPIMKLFKQTCITLLATVTLISLKKHIQISI